MVKTTGDLWGDGPPVPEGIDELACDASCQGILASTLWQALQQPQQEDPNNDEDDESDDDKSHKEREGIKDQDQQNDDASKEIFFDPEGMDRIMNSLGRSMMDSSLSTNAEQQHPQQQQNGQDKQTKLQSALLIGKVASYNRHGTRWRLLVKDVQIRQRKRVTLPKTKHRPSLWEAHSMQQAVTSDVISVPGVMEILAYNDKE